MRWVVRKLSRSREHVIADLCIGAQQHTRDTMTYLKVGVTWYSYLVRWAGGAERFEMWRWDRIFLSTSDERALFCEPGCNGSIVSFILTTVWLCCAWLLLTNSWLRCTQLKGGILVRPSAVPHLIQCASNGLAIDPMQGFALYYGITKLIKTFAVFLTISYHWYTQFRGNDLPMAIYPTSGPLAESTCIMKSCSIIYIMKYVQMMCYDFTRAFDKVSRAVIDCNLPCSFVSLMLSYLSNRVQHDVLDQSFQKLPL